MNILTDLKRSLVEVIRSRLTSNFSLFTDPPTGGYSRPAAYLTFENKKKSTVGFVGTILWQYDFTFTIENKEDPNAVPVRVDHMEDSFVQGELLDFYHFSNNSKYRREGKIIVKTYKIQEGGKERMKNALKAELSVIF